MGILAWILFGFLAGALAQFILPGNDPGGRGFRGFLITTILGIVGAIVGGLIGSALGFGGVSGFNIGSLLIAILGTIVVLVLWRSFSRRTA
jgi:uncharacterized membrane protein YeaQ/YmgE (transglycosylase-associated protein family)